MQKLAKMNSIMTTNFEHPADGTNAKQESAPKLATEANNFRHRVRDNKPAWIMRSDTKPADKRLTMLAV